MSSQQSSTPATRRSPLAAFDRTTQIGIIAVIAAVVVLIILIGLITLLPAQTIAQTQLAQASEQQKTLAGSLAHQAEAYINNVAYDLLSLSPDQQKLVLTALRRISVGAEYINYLQPMLTDMPRLVGFDWFDVSRSLEFGAPPHRGLIFAGKFDALKIGAALSARNFQKIDVNGVPVWTRFEDGQTNISAREPGDPFGGNLGIAARVALLPGYIANSRFTEGTNSITAIVGAYKHTTKSLADAVDFQAATHAVTDPQTYHGSLIQAAFFPPETFSYPPASAQGINQKVDVSGYAELPPYALAVLADRQEGAEQVVLVGLVYSDADSAQRASTELQKRLASFDPAQLLQKAGVKADSPRVYKAADGQSVAVAALRYPLPPPSTAAPGLVFNMWMRALQMRQFYPLDVEIPAH